MNLKRREMLATLGVAKKTYSKGAMASFSPVTGEQIAALPAATPEQAAP